MRRNLWVEEKAKLKGEYLKKTEAGFERMFGDGKLDELRTFVEKDDQACEIVDELWQWMMEKQIGVDEKSQDEIKKRECPKCGGIGRSRKKKETGEEEKREVLGSHGLVGYEREGYYCGRCRKVFFPCGSADGVGDGRIQSEDA